jgi:group I intron endonuclease
MFIRNPTQYELINYKGVIYRIVCLINGKSYIGRAKHGFWKRYISGRWYELTANFSLKMDAYKYGIDKFRIEILEINIPEEKLDLWEDYAVDVYDCLYPKGYNLVPGGNTKVHTEVTREKLAISHRGTQFVLIKNHRTGEITKVVNIADFSRKNNLKKCAMEKVSHGLTRHHKGYSLPEYKILKWLLVSPDGVEHEILEFEMRAFCRKHRFSRNLLRDMILGKRESYRGWTCPNYRMLENDYYLRSPDDILYTVGIRFVERFARTNNLNPTMLRSLANNQIPHFAGWTMAQKGMGFYSTCDAESNITFSIKDSDIPFIWKLPNDVFTKLLLSQISVKDLNDFLVVP